MAHPYISVVIPVYNEQAVLGTLYQRLTPVMEGMGKPYEIIFVNDGSNEKTTQTLDTLFQQHPKNIRVIHLNTHYGQHLAIMAGLENMRGEIAITLSANLQNAPEEIPNLVAKIAEGYDVVGGYREDYQGSAWRKKISQLSNRFRAKMIPNLKMKDQSCMLRAYRRHIVDLMIASGESNTFVNALALSYSRNATEIPVTHRTAGKSNYNLYKSVHYYFDLITSFSLAPLQFFTMLGISVSAFSGILVFYLFLRRLIEGPEAGGVFTLFAIAFFLVGLCLLGLGILGEYIGRVYQDVRKRPRFMIREIVEKSVNSQINKT
jgi:undecaprenyl-phosphate 4-deoxy-4-formamido-L-arabinose transferase